MAFGVLRTFMSRLEDEEKMQLQQKLPTVMRQFEVADGTYHLREFDIEEIERPPIIELEAYRQKFHAEAQPT
jgi:hypothetical protein